MAVLERLQKIFRLPRLFKSVVNDPERSSVSDSAERPSIVDTIELFTVSDSLEGSIESEDEGTTGPKPFKPTADDEAAAKLWKVYVDQAKEYEENLLKEWKADMEALLIFSALYSASLTAFIIESYKTLQDDPAQNTVDLLTRISHQLANETFETPPPFEPPTSALACNIMWFLSLALALACSLLATFVQQWTRDFIHKTTIRPSPIRKARVIALLRLGLHDFGMQAFVDVIPILLHLSLFLFFGGLVGFLLPVNGPLTFVMAGVLVVFLTVYLYLTVLPLLYLHSPYRTPLSGILWQTGNISGGLLAQKHGLVRADETLTEAVLEKSVMEGPDREKRDGDTVVLTMRSLTDDDELLPFIEAIPDYLYDLNQNHVRWENVKPFQALLDSDDPELNIWSRIGQFVSKCGYWSGNFQTRSSQACVRAIQALAQVYIEQKCFREEEKGLDLHFQFIQSMPSLFPVVAIHSRDDFCSALAALGICWIHLDRRLDKQHLVFETFQTISLHASPILQISDASQYMLARDLRKHRTSHVFTSFDIESDKQSIESVLSENQGGKVWHIIQIIIFCIYLTTVRNSDTIPPDFATICGTIYPHKAPLEIDNYSHTVLSKLLCYDDRFHLLRQHVEGMGVPNKTTDAFIRQSLKLFFSTSKPLCESNVAQEWRQFILSYFCRRCETSPPNRIWETFRVEDMERVGQCILDQIQDLPNDVEQSSVCLEVSFITILIWDFRMTGGFFLKLFNILHTSSLDLAFKMKEGYPILKTLLDTVICFRLIMSARIPPEILEQTQTILAQDYLLPHFICLDTLDSELHRGTFIAVISHYIEVSCKFNMPSYCVGVFSQMGGWPVVSSVHESIQALFTKSIVNLVEGMLSGLLDHESAELILFDVMGCFHHCSWKWITDQQSAKVLLDVISQYQKPEGIQIPEKYAWVQREGEEGKQELLEHCRKLVSEGLDMIDSN
ncbi:hypothetical protein VKT23_002520 [Stygiomarasmius scandens]|uniref:DUF6535 domain-containing protein n=1 Tax=Marasmiellus scandens TaxID=2682957 RepID=A0ABR1K292_9AGAR